MDHFLERAAGAPAGFFEHRPLAKSDRVTDTQVRDRLHTCWKTKLAAKHRGLHDADPPDADAFGSCRQPKILDGAASARAHGLGLSGGPQDGFFAISKID